MNKLVGMALIVTFAWNCRPKSQTSRVAYILGANDIVTVSEKNDIPNVRKATVVIATRKTNGSSIFCTGSMIKNKEGVLHVVTNHHCFAEEGPDGSKLDTLIPEACKETRIFFDFTSDNSRKAPFVKCLPGSLRTDPRIDVGVFQLQENPPSDAQSLSFFKGDPSGRKALIFHHPARVGGFAKDAEDDVSLPVAALTINDCKILGYFSPDDIKLDQVLQVSLRHTCDLDLGSSGSALIDAETSQVIGINWGGITIVENDKGISRKDNTATMAGFAEAFLNQIPYEIPNIADSGQVKKNKVNGIGCSLQAGPKSVSDFAKASALLTLGFLGIPLWVHFARIGKNPKIKSLIFGSK
ncbi:MAG: trypsin-like peptidase domain-containing protein [Pseudomonadota bacterium]